MNKQEKTQFIDDLVVKIKDNNHFYITDISDLNVEDTYKLRKLCFDRKVKLEVVKNTLLKKALLNIDGDEQNFNTLYEILNGPTSIMFCENANDAAKVIQEFRKKKDRPILKAAFVEQSCYIGDDQLEALVNLKSKNELIGDVILMLQSPAKNVISALQSGSNKLAGIVKTLSEK
ncbi:MAG: 50S ribosomal protein L10 [Bacteroidetes bacterium GWF2_29_10]|nr:MAG: 50S ribosomal protein L10 [Bacteroidetes bacterium GWF2_29_10]